MQLREVISGQLEVEKWWGWVAALAGKEKGLFVYLQSCNYSFEEAVGSTDCFPANKSVCPGLS